MVGWPCPAAELPAHRGRPITANIKSAKAEANTVFFLTTQPPDFPQVQFAWEKILPEGRGVNGEA
jgi:hypothetical protein